MKSVKTNLKSKTHLTWKTKVQLQEQHKITMKVGWNKHKTKKKSNNKITKDI